MYDPSPVPVNSYVRRSDMKTTEITYQIRKLGISSALRTSANIFSPELKSDQIWWYQGLEK